MILDELEYRRAMWRELLERGGPTGVAPSVLHELGIYGGAQGIWVDKERTKSLTPRGEGVTVGLLHKGSSYPDDLCEDGVLYHYPRTNRPEARDLGEIEATKKAGQLQLPVFIITSPSQNSKVRDVHFGWIEGWDDTSEIFLVPFQSAPPQTLLTAPNDDLPFELIQKHVDSRTLQSSRPNQQRFRFLVFQRYGPQCAVCDMNVPQLLDAVHIVPRKNGGVDDPRNGLVLCATHHRALDAGLFCIDPHTYELHLLKNGPDKQSLHITRGTLTHLKNSPHSDAVLWLWNQWED
ncbi:MAG: HNH endonuclease [Anaerolineae bacterium]|nr:HNH endonuclease [Anaerolineae bacterium]